MNDQARTDSPKRMIERFNIHHRIQHALMALSFILLVITGFPLRFAQAGMTQVIVKVFGGIAVASILHRIGAVILIVSSIYHLGYLMICALRGRFSWEMLPGIKDFKHFVQHVAYYVGLRKELPYFGRYSYIEKFEYWAVMWGSLVMILTGLVLWFPVAAATRLDPRAINIALIFHDYEALLAAVAIFIWHFYQVHFNPHVFPMSTVWLDGKISMEDLKREHPQEYERLFEKGEKR